MGRVRGDRAVRARGLRGSIPPEWLGTYFRWWGIYTQGDGVGAVGGKGGEGKAVPYFMVRIRIPNGVPRRPPSCATIADLTERHARGIADLTVRQNIQLHWVRSRTCPRSSRPSAPAASQPRHLRRRDPQHHRLPARRPRRRRDRRRLAARARGDRDGQRQPRVLQPAAQVQGLDHRLPRLVHLSRDQRRGPHRRARPATGTGRLLAAGRRRALHRAAPRAPARRLRAPGAGAPGGQGRLRDLPRQRRAAPEPREGAAQVPLPAITAGPRSASRTRSRSGSAFSSIRPSPRPARRGLSRPRRHPSAEAGGTACTRACRSCAGGSPRTRCGRSPDLAEPLRLRASCAPPPCRTSSSSTCRAARAARLGARR